MRSTRRWPGCWAGWTATGPTGPGKARGDAPWPAQAGGGTLQVVCNGMTLDQNGIGVPTDLSYQWTTDTGEEHLLRAGDRLICLVSDDNQDYYILKKAVWQ